MSCPKYLTEDDLAAFGYTPDDVTERCPWAVLYTALDGQRCWLYEEIAPTLGTPEEGDEP